jgi:hypothetical protein
VFIVRSGALTILFSLKGIRNPVDVPSLIDPHAVAPHQTVVR